MPKAPTGFHEDCLKAFCARLAADGYHVVETHGKIPDAIATKDGKLVAVELIVKTRRAGGWRPMGGYTQEGKRRNYSMYDAVLIETVRKE